MFRFFAAAIREAATSRTWVTPPAEPSTSALASASDGNVTLLNVPA